MRPARVVALALACVLGATSGAALAASVRPADAEVRGHARPRFVVPPPPSLGDEAATLDGARAELAAIPGVEFVNVDGDEVSAEFHVRLADPTPDPDVALDAYRAAHAVVRAGTPAAAMLLVMEAGSATGSGFSVTEDPLLYADDPPGPDAVGDAAALLTTPGVLRVDITAERTDIRVTSPTDLTEAAAVARGLKRGVSSLTVGHTGSGFTGPDALTVPDDALLTLVADTLSRPGATVARLDASAEPATAVLGALLNEIGANTVDVSAVATDASDVAGGPLLTVQTSEGQDTAAWLAGTDHAERARHPIAYHVTSAGAGRRTGWVSARDPASFPTPAVADARECTGRDLRVGLTDLGGRGGRRYADLVVTNVAWKACAISRTPGLETRTADRTTPPIQVQLDPSMSREVSVLVPGDQATLPMSWPTGGSGVPLTQIVVTFTDVRPMHLDLPPGAHSPGPVRVGSWQPPLP
ncbi:DUF4232 domain-containing protein [Promicromonospora soli]